MCDAELTWQVLPCHIVAKVMSYLDLETRYFASTACEAWYNGFMDPSSWCNIELHCESDDWAKYSSIVHKFLRYMKHVSIYMDQGNKLSRECACTVLHALARTAERRLERLSIKLIGENPLFYAGNDVCTAVSHIFESSNETLQARAQIAHVDLSGLSVTFNGAILEQLAENNSTLTSLNIQNSSFISNVLPKSILKVVQLCKGLKDLRLLHNNLSDSVLLALVDNDRQPLEYLSVICKHEQKFFLGVSNDSWAKLAARSPKITVSLCFDPTCPLDKISELMCSSIPVTELRFETFTWIFKEVNQAVDFYSNTLETLAVYTTRSSGEIDKALINAATNCRKLTTLLVYCVIGTKTIESILELCPRMRERGTYILKDVADPEYLWEMKCVTNPKHAK